MCNVLSVAENISLPFGDQFVLWDGELSGHCHPPPLVLAHTGTAAGSAQASADQGEEDVSRTERSHFVPVLFDVACGLLEENRDAEGSWSCIVQLSIDQHPELSYS